MFFDKLAPSLPSVSPADWDTVEYPKVCRVAEIFCVVIGLEIGKV